MLFINRRGYSALFPAEDAVRALNARSLRCVSDSLITTRVWCVITAVIRFPMPKLCPRRTSPVSGGFGASHPED